MCFGRGLWDTAIDVSSVGDTRRGREGDSWDIGLGIEVTCVWVRGLGAIFEGLREPLLGGGDPSDNRESASMHASRSRSDTVFGSRSDLSSRDMCVTKETGPGRAGGG